MNPSKLAWPLAFVYLAYAALSDIPALSTLAAFSTVSLAGVYILLYFFHSYVTFGIKKATIFFAIAAAVGYAFEYLFISTGLVGNYVYTSNLSPMLGPIPVFIPLLWASLGYFCLLAGGNYLVSAVLMVLLDISFDPKFSTTLWRWVPPGQYFGVPLSNFLGWFVTALVIFVLYFAATRQKVKPSTTAIAFYLLLGLFIGAAPDFVPGLYLAGEISIVLFAVASLLVYLYSRRGLSPAKTAT